MGACLLSAGVYSSLFHFALNHTNHDDDVVPEQQGLLRTEHLEGDQLGRSGASVSEWDGGTGFSEVVVRSLCDL